MTVTDQSEARAPHPTPVALDAGSLRAQLADLRRTVAQQAELLSFALDRITALESTRPGPSPAKRQRDELDARILAFLADHPQLVFTAGNVGENLDGDPRRTADRVTALADSGRINSRKPEGKTRVYWHKAGA